MPALEHPSEAMLAAVLNEVMPPERVEQILEHLDDCERCERRLEELEPGIAEYRQFRQRILPQLPQPLHPWADLGAGMDRVDRKPSKIHPISGQRSKTPREKRLWPAWMSAVAAGMLIAGLMLWPRGDGLLRAETLLRRASNATAKAPSRAHLKLRVKTRTASFVRPAVMAGGADASASVRSRFEAAHYDWNDPLNPAAFEQWRNALHNKVDRVAVNEGAGPKEYTIHTTTQEGGLREAALTLEANEMLPVSGRFEFEDAEWVEIATIPETPSTAPLAEVAPTIPVAPMQPAAAARPIPGEAELGERELNVRSAIDRLHGAVGQPVGIEVESGNIVVTVYNMAPQQEGQLRAGLRDMEGVVVRTAERGPDSGPETPPASQAALAAPFPAIDTSEAIVSRAHLLNQLATRFTPELQAKLNATARGTLDEMRMRHLAAINKDIETLAAELSNTRPLSIAKAPRDAGGTSPPSFAAMTRSATAVHRLVTSVYAGGTTQVDAASAWPELSNELSRLRILARHLSETMH